MAWEMMQPYRPQPKGRDAPSGRSRGWDWEKRLAGRGGGSGVVVWAALGLGSAGVLGLLWGTWVGVFNESDPLAGGLMFYLFFVPMFLAVVGIGIAGAVYWFFTGAVPASWVVRADMVVAAIAVCVAAGAWLA